MRRLALLTLVAACGSPSATPDAPPRPDGGRLVEGPNPVTVRLALPADYIKYRNGSSGWGDPERISDLEYRLHVDDAYQVIVACEDEDMGFRFADSELHGRALADGDDFFFGCYSFADEPSDPSPPRTVAVTGQMAQRGRLYMGGRLAYSTSGPWPFTFDIFPGVHDLVALDTSDRIAIRRDIAIAGATSIPTIDLAQEGAALEPLPFTLRGTVPGETVTSTTALFTAQTYAIIDGDASQLLVPPSSLLATGDRQDMTLSAEIEDMARSVDGPLDPAQLDFLLMPPLAKGTFSFSVPDNRTLRADWSMLPALDELEIAISGYLQWQSTMVTKAFLAATQRTHIAFDTPLDFDREWRVDLRAEYGRSIIARRYHGSYTYESSRYDLVTNVLGN